METTGERIKIARIAKGMTQQELADKVGVKFSAIHKYEAGLVVNLKRDMIAKLASALDVRPSYLLCIDEKEENPAMIGEVSKERLDLIRFIANLSEDEFNNAVKKFHEMFPGK